MLCPASVPYSIASLAKKPESQNQLTSAVRIMAPFSRSTGMFGERCSFFMSAGPRKLRSGWLLRCKCLNFIFCVAASATDAKWFTTRSFKGRLTKRGFLGTACSNSWVVINMDFERLDGLSYSFDCGDLRLCPSSRSVFHAGLPYVG